MTRPRRPDLPLLTEHLESLRDQWDGRNLESDPLGFPHLYAEEPDRELVAFLAASLAFGRVASIRASVTELLATLGDAPARRVRKREWDGVRLARFTHRWVRGADVEAVLLALGSVLESHGSLGALFAAGDGGEADFVPALDLFYARLRREAGPSACGRHGVRFLLPAPGDGSAAKRAHLYLRWMVRGKGFDLGLWRGGGFTPARLLLPLDTHVHRISRYLGLTARTSPDLRAAREATGWLRRIDPEDPVSFDWALSRLGILAECVREKSLRHCERCAVRPVCGVARRPAPSTPAPEVHT